MPSQSADPPPQKEKSLLEWLKEWGGIIAIFLTVVAPILSHLHFRKTRARSIRDEFWVRQVAYPHVLQPCFEFIEWCAESLPDERPHTIEKLNQARQDFRSRQRSLNRKIEILNALETGKTIKQSCFHNLLRNIFNKTRHGIFQEFQSSMETIEDKFMQHLGKHLELGSENLRDPSYQQTISDIQGQTKQLVESLYKWQNDL